jgi:predicted dehydrogenase
MWAPQVEQGEPLKIELDYFMGCINGGKAPINDGHAGLRVVKMLEAANQSVSKRGELVYL